MKKILAVLGLSLFLTACGQQTYDDETIRIGITKADLANPVWAELVQEAVAYSADRGIQITYLDAANNPASQVGHIENFVQSGMDAIIVTAVESTAIRDAVARARAEGVVIVAYTQVLDEFDAQFLVDAFNTGFANGRRAGQWVTETFGSEEEVLWALMDLPIFPEIIERANGIIAGVEQYAPNARLVATASALTAEEGMRNIEIFFQANPDIRMIATIGGGGAVGGNEGLRAVGFSDFEQVGLFGIDATQQEIQNILASGPQRASVSLGGGRTHGRTLIDLAYDQLVNNPGQVTEYMPITVIDESNAQAFYNEQWGN